MLLNLDLRLLCIKECLLDHEIVLKLEWFGSKKDNYKPWKIFILFIDLDNEAVSIPLSYLTEKQYERLIVEKHL